MGTNLLRKVHRRCSWDTIPQKLGWNCFRSTAKRIFRRMGRQVWWWHNYLQEQERLSWSKRNQEGVVACL